MGSELLMCQSRNREIPAALGDQEVFLNLASDLIDA